MSGMFWNPRGINDSEKKSAIFEAIKDYKLGFVGLQETRSTNYSSALLKSLVGNLDFTWACSPSRGFAGGILLGVSKELYDVLEKDCGIFYVRCLVKYKKRVKYGI